MKILIVDDMHNWQVYHKQILNELFSKTDIIFANSAKEGYQKLLENNNSPFDIIITDLQMELDYEPKHAGEWFVEQIQSFRHYYKTKIIIISGASDIALIAKRLNVDYITKATAVNFPQAYESLLK